MCEISSISVIASGATSIMILGRVTGECNYLGLRAQFPDGSEREGEGVLTPGSDENEQKWTVTFTDFDEAVLKDWCKGSGVAGTVFCVSGEEESEGCVEEFAVHLICCPEFTNLGFQSGDCYDDDDRTLRNITWQIRVDFPRGFTEEIALKLSVWRTNSSANPPVMFERSFNASPEDSSPIYPVMLPLRANREYRGRITFVSPSRCSFRVTIEPFTVPDCACAEPPLPEDFFTVKNSDGSLINDPNNTGCATGNQVVVIAGAWNGTLIWSATVGDDSADFVVDPNDERTVRVNIPDDGTRVLVTALLHYGSCIRPLTISVKKCGVVPTPPCEPVPDNYELKVFDIDGNEIPPGQCVPGSHADVVAPEHEGSVVWKLDGQQATADSGLPRRLRVRLDDDNEHTVEATVGKDKCEKPVKRTFKRCPGGGGNGNGHESRIDLCSLVRLFFLLGVGIAAIGAVLIGCPQFTMGFFGEYQWAIGAAVLAFGAFIAVVAFAVMIVLSVAGICPMSWCSWLTLFWQGLFLIGALFIYASFCCPWFAVGWVIFLVALGLFILWVMKCRPSTCTIFHQLLFLLIVFDICQIIEAILGQCVLTGNILFALAWGVAALIFNVYVMWGLSHYRCLRD